MHKLLNKHYFFIDKNPSQLLNRVPKNTILIYRNYKNKLNINNLVSLKNICRNKGIKFYISNNIKLAIKLDLDGAYIPAFNKSFSHNAYKFKKNFKLIGSAHNLSEIRIKEKQNVSSIFVSSIFRNNKSNNFLGIYRFFNLMNLTSKNVVCLGGINENNIKKIKLLNLSEIASISMFQKIIKKA